VGVRAGQGKGLKEQLEKRINETVDLHGNCGIHESWWTYAQRLHINGLPFRTLARKYIGAAIGSAQRDVSEKRDLVTKYLNELGNPGEKPFAVFEELWEKFQRDQSTVIVPPSVIVPPPSAAVVSSSVPAGIVNSSMVSVGGISSTAQSATQSGEDSDKELERIQDQISGILQKRKRRRVDTAPAP
jgi:hypothetical protein